MATQIELFEVAEDGRKASVSLPDAQYRAASAQAQDLAAWNPHLGSADGDWLRDRDRSVARVRDLVRNDGHAHSAIVKTSDMLVGGGLRLSAKPDHRALGITPEQALEMGDRIEAEWSQFADDPLKRCDLHRRYTMSGIQMLFMKELRQTGEACGLMQWKPERGARYATCVQVVDPDRLSNPQDRMDTEFLRRGVALDEDGAPIGYWFRRAHPGDWMTFSARSSQWDFVERETEWGRPVVIHAFEADRADQSRGVPDMASIVGEFRMLGEFRNLELANATINALFAAFIKSGLDPASAAEMLETSGGSIANMELTRAQHYSEAPVSLGGVRIPVLPIGDEISMNSDSRQTSEFASFQAAFLQSIATATGMSYEQLSMDWSKTNYSSARAALNEVWRWARARSRFFADSVMSPIYLAFLEEAFDKGYVDIPAGAPGFHEMPAAYARAAWIGPPRGYVDPVKDAQGAQVRMETMTSTLEQECAEQGLDWRDVIAQRARERKELDDRGLSTDTSAVLGVVPASDRQEQRPQN
jgi:lambda family phage portal protein